MTDTDRFREQIAKVKQHAVNHAPVFVEQFKGEHHTHLWEQTFFAVALQEVEASEDRAMNRFEVIQLREVYSVTLASEILRILTRTPA